MILPPMLRDFSWEDEHVVVMEGGYGERGYREGVYREGGYREGGYEKEETHRWEYINGNCLRMENPQY